MSEALRARGYAVTELIEGRSRDAPTRANIIRHLRQIRGATIFISYSGHGTQVADRSGDETDGRDEAMFTLDGSVIVDDEVLAILRTKRNSVVKVFYDCCHSGTLCDLWGTVPQSPGRPTTNARGYCSRYVSDPAIFCISSSLDSQVSYETAQGGILTSLLRDSPRNITFVEFLERTKRFARMQRSVISTSEALPLSLEVL